MLALETKFLALASAFRFIVFALMVTGLIVHMSRRMHHADEIFRPVARAIVITGLIASQGWWFPLVENTFLSAATHVQFDYTENPTGVADQIREGATPDPEKSSLSWRNIGQSIYRGFTQVITWFFVAISTLLALVMLFLQQVLRWILYFLTPFALGCFMIPSLTGIATRFFQQLVAILAWPVGFALTNIVTLSLWQDFRSTVGFSDATQTVITVVPILNNTGLVVAGLALLIGTLSTPLVCHMLFVQGSAITGASSTPLAIARGASEAITRTTSVTRGMGAAVSGGAATGIGALADKAAAIPQPPALPQNPFVQPPGF